jgi:hypothetical protein
MVFGREVDDEVRLCVGTRVIHIHLAGAHRASLARCVVLREVIGPLVLELQRNAPAHDTDAVHRVDYGVNIVLFQ